MKMLSGPLQVDGATYAAGASFQIPGDVEAIAPLVDRLMELFATQQALAGEDKIAEVALALQEALANAVVHGCQNDASRTVTGEVACGPGQGVVIVVRDPGLGFDAGSIPDPLSKDGLGRHYGRGVHLILQLMDEVRFERNGSELHMSKR